MKKIFTLLVVLAVGSLSAQAQSPYGWYSYGYALEDFGNSPDYFLTHVFPDSTVQVEYSSGLGAVWMHGLGQVFDPTAIYYDGGTTTQLDESDGYMVDSIGFPYRYFRPQTDAGDTLIVQFFVQSDFDSLYVQPWPDSPGYDDRSYARLAYDSVYRRNPNATMEIKKILTDDDIANTVDYMTFEIAEPIPAGEICGAVLTYLPGNPYNFGDTLDVEVVPTPTNLINDFILNYYVDEESNYEMGIYNHAIIATGSGRYDDDSNGWAGQYWPSMASGGGIYHAAIDFHISSYVGIEENTVFEQMRLTPNPTATNAFLSFSSKVEDSFSLSVFDVAGKQVLSENSISVNTGQNRIEIKSELLVPGVYIVNLDNQTSRETIRLIKY